MSRNIISMGHIPKFIIRCYYCNTLFTYNHFDIHRRWILGKKIVNCPRCDTPLKATRVEASSEGEETT